MAINTYSSLKSSVLAKLVRSNDADAQTRVSDWVTLAEDELRLALNRLKVRQGERVDNNFYLTSEYIDFPVYFYAIRSIFLSDVSPQMPLEYLTPAQMDIKSREIGLFNYGKPKYYTIQGNQIRILPIPDVGYISTLTYYDLQGLADNNVTNWLLDAHPKIYYKATLAEAYDYYDDEAARDAAIMERDRLLNALYTSDGSDQQITTTRIRVRGATP